MDIAQTRREVAQALSERATRTPEFKAFVGLDGFVDEIIHVVRQRQSAEVYERMRGIPQFAERIAGAAGRSTNIELVTQMTKLGGNGPIMANALAALGLKVTYVGALGYPNLHPVFTEFAQRAEVHSICEPGHTDALEFDDGKLMVGKTSHFREITWPNIQARFGREAFVSNFCGNHLVAFVNWTMLPYMSDVWAALLQEVCPSLNNRGKIFFDLADPEKRTAQDIQRALELIVSFGKYFDVTLGLNEKEACEVAKVAGITVGSHSREGIADLARSLHKHLPVNTLLIHPVSYAVAVSDGRVSCVDGPYAEKPLITTGAGDHFNAGFCLGKLLGLDNSASLLSGVCASGIYVRTGQSPDVQRLVELMRHWPA